jgi:cyclic pyranopterin phosphate synthase
MVDISAKRMTRRTAQAQCLVVTNVKLETLDPRDDNIDVLHGARLAGVVAAKKTAELIPLCHTISLNDVDVEVRALDTHFVVTATVTATQRTGVEMEALTACAFAALSIVDALRDVDPTAHIDDIALLTKQGGKSGDWGRLVSGDAASATRRKTRKNVT